MLIRFFLLRRMYGLNRSRDQVQPVDCEDVLMISSFFGIRTLDPAARCPYPSIATLRSPSWDVPQYIYCMTFVMFLNSQSFGYKENHEPNHQIYSLRSWSRTITGYTDAWGIWICQMTAIIIQTSRSNFFRGFYMIRTFWLRFPYKSGNWRWNIGEDEGTSLLLQLTSFP